MWVIAPLSTADHDRDPFDCGKPTLNEYLKLRAKAHGKLPISRTFVAIRQGERAIRGYYSQATGHVEREDLPDGGRRLPEEYAVPIVLLARLAVDLTCAGQGLGKRLLIHAFDRTLEIDRAAGVYGVVVDPIDEEAASFYKHFGFEEMESGREPPRMFLSIKKIRQLP